MHKRKIDKNKVWALIGKVAVFILVEIAIYFAWDYIFSHCITVYHLNAI